MDGSVKEKKKPIIIHIIMYCGLVTLLASLMIPAMTGALVQHYRPSKDARNIHLRVFLALAEDTMSSVFPEFGRFKNSNEYFVFLMQSGVLEEDWLMFTGRILTPVHTDVTVTDLTSLVRFSEENNIWSVVEGASYESPSSMPFLVSSNLDESALKSGLEKNARPKVKKDKRFKGRVYYVKVGGNSGYLEGRDITWENLNPTEATNKILHPGPAVQEGGME